MCRLICLRNINSRETGTCADGFGLVAISQVSYVQYTLGITFSLLSAMTRDRPKSKQLEDIRNLGEAAFSFKFEGSDLLANLIQGMPIFVCNKQTFLELVKIILSYYEDKYGSCC